MIESPSSASTFLLSYCAAAELLKYIHHPSLYNASATTHLLYTPHSCDVNHLPDRPFRRANLFKPLVKVFASALVATKRVKVHARNHLIRAHHDDETQIVAREHDSRLCLSPDDEIEGLSGATHRLLYAFWRFRAHETRGVVHRVVVVVEDVVIFVSFFAPRIAIIIIFCSSSIVKGGNGNVGHRR